MSFMPEVKMEFVPSDEESEIDTEEMIEANLPTDINTAEDIKEIIEEVQEPVPVTQNVEEIFNMQPAITDTTKLTKKGKPRKKRPPMTEEQKEKLKKAREKAMAVRKARAEERKKEKDLDNQEKELLKKQKIKKVKKLKEEVEEKVEEEVPPPPEKQSTNSFVGVTTFTKKDLEEAQLDAILKYDTIRKARKKDKQERLQKEKEENLVRETLRRQITPQKQYNPFDNCY